MSIFIIALVIFIISFLCAPLTLRYAKKMALIDAANERSCHTGIVPRGGGILFIIFFYIGVLLAAWLGYLTMPPFVWILLVGAIFMASVGWLDDFKSLSVTLRFFIQLITVINSGFHKCPHQFAWVSKGPNHREKMKKKKQRTHP